MVHHLAWVFHWLGYGFLAIEPFQMRWSKQNCRVEKQQQKIDGDEMEIEIAEMEMSLMDIMYTDWGLNLQTMGMSGIGLDTDQNYCNNNGDLEELRSFKNSMWKHGATVFCNVLKTANPTVSYVNLAENWENTPIYNNCHGQNIGE